MVASYGAGRSLAVAAILVLLSAATSCSSAPPARLDATAMGDDDIAGTVTGPSGPEAGVWVIAETTDLPTRFARIVVTDDAGRYLIPDLPEASYSVWVRGYGLVDSPRTQARPGRILDLDAVAAPTPHAAAYYYPAGYWYSLLEVPAAHEFPGTGPEGNGISPNMQNQAQWRRMVGNNACLNCHQMGGLGTRNLPDELGSFPSSVAAWEHRIRAGQAGGSMVGATAYMGERVLQLYAEWTDRIAEGEIPPAPPRPQGIERNVVITLWDWADEKAYLHDLVSTDRRDPTVNAYGPLYGALEASADYLPVLDPRTHTATRVPVTFRDPATPRAAPTQVLGPSPYWGDEAIWTSRGNVHNPMFDERGRVWITQAVRPPENPDFCRAGSDHPSARLFPLERSSRHLAMYDPTTGQFTHVSTCFGTHHLMFAEDHNNTLWTSGGGQVVGWLNTRLLEETGDEVAAQGWTALIMDTNGNGRRDAYVEPNEPVDPTRDKRYNGAFYAVSPAPDGSVWGSQIGYPGAVIRLVPGDDPPHTTLAEVYEPPLNPDGTPIEGFSPRGMDVDRNGVVWVALASGHMGRFDRRRCTGPLNGPTATGQHCPEGWTFYTEPLPQMRNVTTPGSAEGSYYTWVDQFDTFGLGPNTPINTGNLSEGLLVLKDGEWVVLRVPYPLGFYTKWLDGRIDDPDAGWKGRGLWATVSTRAPFHMEGGRGQTSKVLHFQLRPDPLAR
jgi:hypothetical protein